MASVATCACSDLRDLGARMFSADPPGKPASSTSNRGQPGDPRRRHQPAQRRGLPECDKCIAVGSRSWPLFSLSTPWTLSCCYDHSHDAGLFNVQINNSAGDIGPSELWYGGSGRDYYYDIGTFGLYISHTDLRFNFSSHLRAPNRIGR